MDAYTIERTDKSVTLGFKNADPTVITPMFDALNNDKNVTTVRYIDQHPELCDVVLYVEVKKGNPSDTVKKASKTVSAYFSSVKQ